MTERAACRQSAPRLPVASASRPRRCPGRSSGCHTADHGTSRTRAPCAWRTATRSVRRRSRPRRSRGSAPDGLCAVAHPCGWCGRAGPLASSYCLSLGAAVSGALVNGARKRMAPHLYHAGRAPSEGFEPTTSVLGTRRHFRCGFEGNLGGQARPHLARRDPAASRSSYHEQLAPSAGLEPATSALEVRRHFHCDFEGMRLAETE